MAKMIQIRNVPDSLHRSLKVRAAQLGMTLSDYLLLEIQQIASRPTMQEFLSHLESRRPVSVNEPPGKAQRHHRDS